MNRLWALILVDREVYIRLPSVPFVYPSSFCSALFSNSTSIVCELPEGTGTDQPVVVSANGLLSKQVRALSYARPTITAVEVRSRAIAHGRQTVCTGL